MSEHEMSMQELIDWMPGYEWIMPPESDDELLQESDEPEKPESQLEIRAITLWQPWASLIALKLKRYETRCWSTSYRGKLLIHAAKRPIDERGIEVWEEAHRLKHKVAPDWRELPLGKVVAIANLTACLEMVGDLSLLPPSEVININLQTETEELCGDWREGRFAWKLEDVKAITPIPAKGKQQLWTPDSDLIAELAAQGY